MNMHLNTNMIDVLLDPTEEDLRTHFAPYVFQRIIRHLDPATGDVSRGEFQCVSIGAVVFNPFSVRVFYRTKRPDGKDGTQFMDFSPFTEMTRCLPVTFDGRVVMILEHRRQRGEWALMLPAGGDKKGRTLDVVLDELLSETGCKPTLDSRIIEVARRYADDGAHAERLAYATVDKLEAPREHQNSSEGIRSIFLVPFDEWLNDSQEGRYDDPFCEFFAARCRYDHKNGRIVINGRHKILR